jgi:threonine dehydratase
MTGHAAWYGDGRPRTSPAIGLAEIRAARTRIAGTAVRTPMKPSAGLSDRLGTPVLLKVETMQPTGAFKLRGAANNLLSLGAEEKRRGVITVSTGNHGRAVAYVAQALGIRCIVCLSSLVPQHKIDSVRVFGAELDIGGVDQDVALDRARQRAVAEGLTMISPFDDSAVIAGQGTAALEILDDVPDVGTIIVPLSGGGLAAGIGVAAKSLRPGARVVGVSSARCPAMLRSLGAGCPIEVPEHPSLADSLGGGIGLDNRYSFALVRDFVDEIQLVEDDEVAEALRFAFCDTRLVLEGAAAAPIAALLRAERDAFPGPIVVVATGDNIEPRMLVRILSSGSPHFDPAGTGG